MTDTPRPDRTTPSRSRPDRDQRSDDAARAAARADDVAEAEVVEGEVVDDDFGSGAPGSESAAAGPAGDEQPAVGGSAGPDDGAGAPGDHDEPLDRAAAEVEVDLELLLAEREQFLGATQRIQADFENYRRQAHKRQEDAVVRALGGFVEGLLPVLDACDAAVAHGAGSAVEPIVNALYGALEKEGLERIDPTGKRFDPAEAEAVVHEPGGGGEHIVSEVMRAGYRWRGRVLRPAMVKVTD